MEILRTVKADWGTISEFAKKLTKTWESLALHNDRTDFAIEGTEFNGTRLLVAKDSTIENIVKDYHDQLDKSREEYVQSDEYKEKQKKEELELKRMNNEVSELMKTFEVLDFSDYKQVLFWLCELQPYSDRIGVTTPNTAILEKLMSEGYERGKNCGDGFNEEDAENFARYIIGQCIDGLCHIGAIHYMAVKFTEDWKKKFALKSTF